MLSSPIPSFDPACRDPLLTDAIARFECRRHAVHPGGDHDIILGEVLNADRPRESEALVFVRSGYKQI